MSEQAEMRRLEKSIKVAPFFFTVVDQWKVEAWRKRMNHKKTLRQLRKCREALFTFSESVKDSEPRTLLSAAVGALDDCIFNVEEAKQDEYRTKQERGVIV
jgi:hypothetical protein